MDFSTPHAFAVVDPFQLDSDLVFAFRANVGMIAISLTSIMDTTSSDGVAQAGSFVAPFVVVPYHLFRHKLLTGWLSCK